MPGLSLGDPVPNLQVETTHGTFKLHDFIGDSFAIIFAHPADFTPVCTTELAKMAAYADKFTERGVKLLGFSCDDISSHKEWIKDIEAFNRGKHRVSFPIAADPTGKIIEELNMVDSDETNGTGSPVPSRALHIVGADKKLKLSFLYPGSIGRNVEEVLRVVDALQMAAKHRIVTPANWKQGDPVVVTPGVSSDEAKKLFPQGYTNIELPSGKDYLRFTNV